MSHVAQLLLATLNITFLKAYTHTFQYFVSKLSSVGFCMGSLLALAIAFCGFGGSQGIGGISAFCL
jgi:hypothetical protein